MTEPAMKRETRRAATTRRLRWSALELTRDHGLDGWTMDDLAVAAEVSRRTVFNYFDSKVDVVLGHPPDISADDRAEFIAGGPTGSLFDDLVHFAVRAMADQVTDLELERLLREVVPADPRLIALAHQRFIEVGEVAGDLILRREGQDFGERRATLVLRLLVAVLDGAFDAPASDSDRSLTDLVADTAADARDLLRH